MKKFFLGVLFILIVNPVFGACKETTYTFKSGSGASYDEYLYSNTQNRELRNEDKQEGSAYLCGGGCDVGTKIRLSGAAVGGGQPNADAVYECKNTGNSSRANYQWVVYGIEQSCTVKAPLVALPVNDVQNGDDLRIVGDKYCQSIADSSTNITINNPGTNFWDTANTGIKAGAQTIMHWTTESVNGTVRIIGKLSDNSVRIYEISANATVRVIDSLGTTLVGTTRAVTEGGVQVFKIANDTFVKSLKISTDGVVQILGIGGKIIETFSDNATKSYIATLDLFKTGIKETGATVRALSGDARDVAVRAISGGVEIVGKFVDSQVQTVKYMTNGAVQIVDITGKTVVGVTKATADGVVKIFDSTGKTFVASLKVLTDGSIEILKTTGDVIKTISKNTSEMYKATLIFMGTFVSEFGSTVRTAIQAGAQVVGITIQELGATVRSVSGDVKDVAVSAISGGVEITTTLINNNTERFRIATNGVVSMYGSTTQMVSSSVESMVNGGVKVTANLIDGAVRTFEIGTDGVVKVVQVGGDVVKKLSGDALNGLRAVLGTINNAITEAGKTVRAISSDVKDVAVAGIAGGTEIMVNFSDNVTERFKIMANGTVQIVNTAGQTVVGVAQAATDGTVRIIESANKTFLGALKIATDGTVKVLNIGGRVVKSISRDMTDAYKSTLQFFGARMDSFDETVRVTIKAAADTVGIAIQTVGLVTTTAMNNATDFSKHFVTEIAGVIKDWNMDDEKLEELEKQIAKCTTQEQVADLINKALREAELNDTQCAQVRGMINEYAATVNVRFDVIDRRIGDLETELREHKLLTNEIANKVAYLGGQYVNLAAQMRTKVNAKQVVQLIEEHTQRFSDGQVEQLYEILAEYTRKLSAGQRAEVEHMIAKYVDPKIQALNKRLEEEAKRRAATDKLNSAMSVLNSFASGAKVSVWKNKDGGFNTARLASDATAGVVLGTVGGLVTNKLVKKNQVKKGFEKINCSVNGQVVAGYADEFTVGVQQ